MFFVDRSERNIATTSELLIAAAARRGMTAVGHHVMKWHEIQPGAEHGPECRVYDFCNAAWMRQALEGSNLAAAALPCRVAVYEDEHGVMLAMTKFAAFLAAAIKPSGYKPFHQMEQNLIEAIREVCDGRPGGMDPADGPPSATKEDDASLAPLALEFA